MKYKEKIELKKNFTKLTRRKDEDYATFATIVGLK